MKSHLLISTLFLGTFLMAEEERRSGAGAAVLPAESKGPTADITNDEQFIAKRAAALARQEAPLPEPPRPSSFSLLEMSTLIQGDGIFLIVPKGALLWCPPELGAKIVSRPSGNSVDWKVFLAQNRSWISSQEVTRDQVTGKVPLPDAQIERLRKSGVIVIATLEGGPVTVLPHQP